MKTIPNDLINTISRLSVEYKRDEGHDVAKFLTYESKLQWRTAYRCKTCDHYGDDKATRDVSNHAFLVYVRYMRLMDYKKNKKIYEEM